MMWDFILLIKIVVVKFISIIYRDNEMETMFVNAFYDKEVKINKDIIKKLPKSLMLFTTAQFINQLENIKKQLISNGKEVKTIKTGHASSEGQLLGCTNEIINEDFDAFLFVGTGKFHPSALIKNNKEIYYYDPINDSLDKISINEIEKLKKKRLGSLKKFYNSRKVGFLISIKPGQNRFNECKKIEEKFKDKEFYYFADNTINLNSLENFPFIEIFVNTMCPRLIDDESPVAIVNMSELGFEF